MAYIAIWQVFMNPPKGKVFKLKKTADNYQKHLQNAFGSKLVYFKVSAA